MTHVVELRDVVEADLPILFEQQREPEANAMAAFPPRDRETFMTHWAKVLANPDVTVRTILLDGEVAGNIGCFAQGDRTLVGYWIGRRYWGRSVATRALASFVQLVATRPLHARVARHNTGSIRVLEKCGFTVCGEDRDRAPTGGDEVEELIYRLGDARAEPRAELLELAAEDERVFKLLEAEGSLHGHYHPRMAGVHARNAARLAAILERHGWPGRSLAGPDGSEAAWRIAQHAIGDPPFLRRCLQLLRRAVDIGEAPAWQAAMLEDRIRVLEGRLQRFGTQLEPDAEGRAHPCAIEDPELVEERRRSAGLEPLSEVLARAERVRVPADRERYRREYEAWLRETGWRT